MNALNEFGPLGQLSNGFFLIPREAYQTFLNYVVDLSGSTVGYLHLFDTNDDTIQLNVWSDGVIPVCHTSHTSHYPLKEAGIWADAVRQGKTVIHQDYEAMHRDDLPEGHFPVKRHASFPIFEGQNIVAVVGIGNSATRYSDETIRLTEDAIEFGWPILQTCLTRIEEDRQKALATDTESSKADSLLAMILAMAHSLQVREALVSPRHPSNVSKLSRMIGEELGLDDQMLYGLSLGAYLHDIGKHTIDQSLLRKTELTTAERSHIEMHASEGASIFRSLSVPWPITDMIAQHHERMDGSGYPEGILGNMICLEARIIGVADTFDAIASESLADKDGRGIEAALAVIRSGRSTLFDPYVTDALDNVLEKHPTLRGMYRR